MRIGIDSFSYHLHFGKHGWSPSDGGRDTFWFLRRARELGADVVQLDPLHIGSLEEEYIERLGNLKRDLGLGIELGTGGCEFEKLKGRLEIGKRLGAACLRTFVGGERDPDDVRKQKLAYAHENFRRLAPVAEEIGIPIAVENHEDLLADEVRDLVAGIGSPLIGVCLDTGNSVVLGEDPLYCVRTLVPYAKCIHLKDGHGVYDEAGVPVRFEGCALGDGELNVTETLRIIREAHPGMTITMEIPVSPRDTEAESLRWEDECVRKSVEYLKRLG